MALAQPGGRPFASEATEHVEARARPPPHPGEAPATAHGPVLATNVLTRPRIPRSRRCGQSGCRVLLVQAEWLQTRSQRAPDARRGSDTTRLGAARKANARFGPRCPYLRAGRSPRERLSKHFSEDSTCVTCLAEDAAETGKASLVLLLLFYSQAG